MAPNHITISKFNGVNRALDPSQIGDDQFETTKNVYEVLPGELALRPQTELINSQGAQNQMITDGVLIPFLDRYGGQWIVTWLLGTNDNPDGGSWYAYNTTFSSGLLLATTDSAERPGWVVSNRKLYVFPGSNNGGYVIDNLSGSTLTMTALTGLWTASSYFGNVGWLYRGSLVLAGYGAEEESTFRFTEPVPGEDTLLAVDKSDYIAKGDGDRIVGGVEIPVAGGSDYMESYSIIWKRNSAWLMKGLPPTGATEGSISITPFMKGEGLVAKETIVKTPMGLIWCSGVNVWILPTGSAQPVPLANELRPMLETMSRNEVGAWHATYYKGFYRLTIPTNENPLVNGATDDMVTQNEQWWLDLREFPRRVSWWGPMTTPCWASAVEEWNGSKRLLQGLSVYDSNTYVYMFVNGDVVTVNHDDAHNNYLGSASPGIELKFKEFAFGDVFRDKLIEKVELSIWADQEVEIEVNMIGDGGDTVQIARDGNGNSTITGSAFGFVLGTSALDSGRLSKKYDVLVGYPPSGGRFMAKTWQPVVKYTPSAEGTGRDIHLKALGAKVRILSRGNR